MTMLSTSAFYERATRNIGSLRGRAESLQTALGTGQKLSRSSDDPVAAKAMRQRDIFGLHHLAGRHGKERAHARLAMVGRVLIDH